MKKQIEELKKMQRDFAIKRTFIERVITAFSEMKADPKFFNGIKADLHSCIQVGACLSLVIEEMDGILKRNREQLNRIKNEALIEKNGKHNLN